MAAEEVINGTNLAGSVLTELGYIGNWLQALGILVIVWIVMQAVTYYFNRKRLKVLYRLTDRLDQLEKKIDAVLKKQKQLFA